MTFTTNLNKITAAYVTQFSDTFEILCQQRESRLLKTVVNEGKITGNTFTINDLGILEMKDRKRFGDTEWDLPEAGVRKVFLKDKSLTVPIDKMDLPKLLANVQSAYMQLCVAAYQRKVDETIYNALIGGIERIEKYNGDSTVVKLPNTQIITSSGNGSIKDKILAAKSIFRSNECDEQNGEQLYILYDAAMMVDILSDTTLTSGDFMSVKMLQEGNVDTKWCGVSWIPYEKLARNDANTFRSSVMYSGTAVHFGHGSAFEVDIGKRRDKNNTIQIHTDASMGAGRANEQKVVEIQLSC